MKEKIHPQYYPDAKVICACGNVFTTGSTRKEIRVELCSKCHPFFTGERRMMDTAGRVERFKRRYQVKEQAPKAAVKVAAKAEAPAAAATAAPAKPAPKPRVRAAKKAE
jgi:large subunit ribosomal protein L31